MATEPVSVFSPIPTKKRVRTVDSSRADNIYLYSLAPGLQGCSCSWHNTAPRDLDQLGIDDIMLIRPAEQAATSALETSVACDSKEQEERTEDSEACCVSNIFRGPGVWGMVRHPPEVKDMSLALGPPTMRKQAQHLASEIYRWHLPNHVPDDREACPV